MIKIIFIIIFGDVFLFISMLETLGFYIVEFSVILNETATL